MATKKKAAKRKTSAKKTTSKTKKKAARKPAAKKKTSKKVARKPAAKKTTKKKVAGKPAAKKKVKKKSSRKPSAAFMKPLQPDAALAEVVGSKPLARTEVVKKLWKYIKKNDLQHSTNRRVIVADAKLKPVFGGKKQVDMFQMTKLVSSHLQ
jgi:upstream activation factor subunit UAF30